MPAYNGRIVIVGVAESDYGRVPNMTELQLHAQAIHRTLEDSGLRKKDIDGVFCSSDTMSMPTVTLCEYVQVFPRYTDSTSIGGASFEAHLNHAMAAIRAGKCEVALISYASNELSSRGRTFGTANQPVTIPEATYEAPYGNTLVGAYAMAARRHMHQYGTTSEQLAEIAVVTRRHAGLNPLAMYRKPITVQDVLDSRMIADPLHLLDCCVVSDGGGAVLVTTEERARDLRQPPVFVLGSSESHTHDNISQMPDLVVTAAAVTGPRAFAEAGVQPGEIDMAMIYDSVHDHRPPAFRRPGILQERGRRSICAGRSDCVGWAITNEYGWRWFISKPSRHAWHFPHHRGGTSTTRAMRSPSSERRKVSGSSWKWRLAFLAGHNDFGTVRNRTQKLELEVNVILDDVFLRLIRTTMLCLSTEHMLAGTAVPKPTFAPAVTVSVGL